MIKNPLLFSGAIGLALLLASCSEETVEISKSSLKELDGFVICKRKGNPWKPYVYESKLNNKQRIVTPNISHSDYLGRSIRLDEFPIEDTRNIGYPVIDTEAFIRDYPSYFQSWKNLASQSSYFSFSNFDDYESKSSVTKKVNGGLNLHFLCFSLGSKNQHTKTFSSDIINSSQSALGELNIVVRDSNYRMQYSSNIQQKIINGYLDKTFLEELHLTHPYEFYKNYGAFVMSDFATGGRATAIYAGVHRTSSDTQTKEADMSSEIESSFKMKWSTDPNSANLTLGRGSGSTTSFSSKFSKSKMSVKTLGGVSSFGSFSIAQDVANASIDLSSWMSSLNTPSAQSLCEFNEGGLIPITNFILEDNLKKLISSYINGSEPRQVELVKPKIVIWTGYFNSPTVVLGASVLTRYGSGIVVWMSEIFFDDEDDCIAQVREWGNKIGDALSMEVDFDGSAIWVDNSITRSNVKYNCYENMILDIGNASKFIQDDMVYILYEPDKKGFSIPNIKEYIDEYGIGDLIKRLKNSALNYSDLIEQNYEINAL